MEAAKARVLTKRSQSKLLKTPPILMSAARRGAESPTAEGDACAESEAEKAESDGEEEPFEEDEEGEMEQEEEDGGKANDEDGGKED